MDGATYAEPAAADADAPRRDYTHALVSEIRLLVRTVSNDPARRVSDLRLAYQMPGEDRARDLSASEIINAVSQIEAEADGWTGITHLGFLQLVRDALVGMTAPATGLTISYTTLVAGDQRSERAESGFALAKRAYALLHNRAAWHRRVAYLLTAFAIVCTLFAAGEAMRASLGKSLLQTLDSLHAQQVAIAAEKLKLETSLDRPASDLEPHAPGAAPVLLTAVPLCDRHRVRGLVAGDLPQPLRGLRLEGSAAERELCGRDTVLARNFEIAHASLQHYREFWPGMVGGIAGGFGAGLQRLGLAAPGSLTLDCLTATSDPSNENTRSAACNNVEFLIAPILQVSTNYVLPITFGFLGSLLYVLLDHFTKLRTNTLSPRDFPLMTLRLIIGLVVAACVSLLISSSAGPASGAAPGSLVASLTLSASGITFLAGFGAEAVVALLQGLVTRVFAAPK